MTELQDSREERRAERRKRREERWKERCGPGNQGQFGIISGRSNNMLTGVFILIIGVAALLKATLTDFPDWLFSWQMLLIAFGMFIGLRHNFRGPSWLILDTYRWHLSLKRNLSGDLIPSLYVAGCNNSCRLIHYSASTSWMEV